MTDSRRRSTITPCWSWWSISMRREITHRESPLPKNGWNNRTYHGKRIFIRWYIIILLTDMTTCPVRKLPDRQNIMRHWEKKLQPMAASLTERKIISCWSVWQQNTTLAWRIIIWAACSMTKECMEKPWRTMKRRRLNTRISRRYTGIWRWHITMWKSSRRERTRKWRKLLHWMRRMPECIWNWISWRSVWMFPWKNAGVTWKNILTWWKAGMICIWSMLRC